MSDVTPAVPLTIEGASVLHQMFHVNWSEWRAAEPMERDHALGEAISMLGNLEGSGTAAYAVLGHKADLMLVHFREDFDALERVQRSLRKLHLFDFFDPASSYLSVVELGLYESTQKVYGGLAAKGIVPFTPDWDTGIGETLERQREAMKPRLYPEIPDSRYLCFYPMDRRRGETKNWYQTPMAERARMMQEHGAVGRRYAGDVRQVISGSIGFDDWEWGVDLFAEDPLVFKKLIYEMRFDEVSAVYAEFGTFWVGRRLRPEELAEWFEVKSA